MPAFTEISAPQLARLIGTPNCPVLLDLRLPEDVATDPVRIPGARGCSYHDLAAALPGLTGSAVVTICHKGLKISHGAAALLRSHGIAAETLEGGQRAWRTANLPAVPIAAIPPAGADGGTLWVTRHRPKIDRTACPWLIRRFVDPMARFLFVPPAEVQAVAERFGATPFDVEGVPFSHHGDACSFDAMLQAFGLTQPALQTMAGIIRGADTYRHDLAPEAAGVLAIALGLSRMYRDDYAQLDAALQLFDALYRWARDAQGELHDWPAAIPAAAK